jgi:hypothetical protein
VTMPPRATDSSPPTLFEQALKFLAVAPIALAILGICYDVGYFARIGLQLFTLFSLSEHLVFAMEGTPSLISAVVAGCIAMAGVYIAERIERPSQQKHSKRTWTILGVSVGAGAVWVLLGVLLYPGLWLFGLLLLCFGLLIGLTEFAEIAGGRSLQLIVMNGGSLLLMVVLAFATGYAKAIDHVQPTSGFAPATISLNDGPPISGRVMRSGERGVLIFDTLDGTVKLKRWDQVRDIELPFK